MHTKLLPHFQLTMCLTNRGVHKNSLASTAGETGVKVTLHARPKLFESPVLEINEAPIFGQAADMFFASPLRSPG
jgi:hypothetical protein